MKKKYKKLSYAELTKKVEEYLDLKEKMDSDQAGFKTGLYFGLCKGLLLNHIRAENGQDITDDEAEAMLPGLIKEYSTK